MDEIGDITHLNRIDTPNASVTVRSKSRCSRSNLSSKTGYGKSDMVALAPQNIHFQAETGRHEIVGMIWDDYNATL